MSYLGSTPTTQSFIAGTDYFNGTGSQVAFTLSRSVNSVNDIEVIVNNVEQIPSGYTVSGTTLTFSVAPSAGTSNVYVRYLSTTLQSITVPAGTTVGGNFGVAGNLTVTANTTTDALRITQTGTGNAFVVEDSTSPDATPFVIKADGKVGLGTQDPQVPLQIAFTSGIPDASLVTSDAVLITAENNAPGFAFTVAGNASASQRGVFKGTRSRGSLSAPTAALSNDNVLSLLGAVYDGTSTLATAGINFEVDGAVSTSVAPQRISFLTGETNSRLERTRIDSAGRLRQFGTTIISNVAVLNASYDSVSFSVAAEETVPTAVFFSADGSKMFVMGTSGDDVNEYVLSTPWAVSSATYSTVFSIAAQEALPQGIFFRADGLKMYVVGTTNDTVFQYALTSPWSVATASYESISFSVATQETAPIGIFFKPDGLSMYITASASDGVYQYTLSTAWNVSTATYLQTFSISAQEAVPQDLSFTGDGTRMFVLGSSGDDVNVYNLTTPWDISTSANTGAFSVAAQDVAPVGLFIKPDGTKMYVVGQTNDTVYQYSVPSVEIQLTGTTSINGSATVAQDLTVNGDITTGGVTFPDGTTQTTAASGGVTSLAAGNGIAVSGATGAVTVTLAAPAHNTIGSYIFAIYTANASGSVNTGSYIAQGTSIAGSSLRYNYTLVNADNYGSGSGFIVWAAAVLAYGGGGTALTGTWRVVQQSHYASNFNQGCCAFKCYWYPIMLVRIS